MRDRANDVGVNAEARAMKLNMVAETTSNYGTTTGTIARKVSIASTVTTDSGVAASAIEESWKK